MTLETDETLALTTVAHGRGQRTETDAGTGTGTNTRTNTRTGTRTARRRRKKRFAVPDSAVLIASALCTLAVLVPVTPPLVRLAAGLYLLFGAPLQLWRPLAGRIVPTGSGRTLVSVGLVIIGDMLLALVVNTVLPWVGVDRPLTRGCLTSATALGIGVLWWFRRRYAPSADTGPVRLWALARATPGLGMATAAGAVTVLCAVAGTIRLNNGYGGAVSIVASVLGGLLLLLLSVRRRKYHLTALETGLYAAALALLLLASLRGWFITGHDVQTEYLFYRMALGGEYWDVSTYRHAYNACLSITLLPVSIRQLTGINDIYIFKAIIPALFALTPVMLFRSVRNVAPRSVALLAAVFFVAFPTFLTDMVFLGRQAIAFVLLGSAIVVLTDSRGPRTARRVLFVVLLVGVVLSHYSTAYVVIATLTLALGYDKVWRLVSRRSRERLRRKRREDRMLTFIQWWMVLIPAVAAVVWAGPVTHTGGQLHVTVAQTISDLVSPKDQAGSSDTGYSLLGGDQLSPQQRLEQYVKESEADSAKERAHLLLTQKELDTIDWTAVSTADMPLTPLGRILDLIGVPVQSLNGAVRAAVAYFFQLMTVLGVWVVLRARRSAFRAVRDQTTMALAALSTVALFTVVPQLSVDYGVLRAFQQGLFFFAPFLAAGTLWVLRWAGHRKEVLGAVLTFCLLLNLVGVMPKVLGGYPAQIQLSNSGDYYDIYYTQSQEVKAALWLDAWKRAREDATPIQMDSFSYTRLKPYMASDAAGVSTPVWLDKDAYLLLGTTPAKTGRVSIFYRGDRITYEFPRELVEKKKDLVYNNGGSVVLR
ncbi:DUF2206 domain-containing protein [Streptomyces sp. NBC_01669]|uniref:DUF2206 domain-containing protein n=1 Tax=Streptomyces sp. NBC_01669 TaxID=2975909 RepID=UPI0022576301|nr:DUF2206 domain-containing protein [Streptomyces sp. NBC_01669]MCX4538321.1 DUF2206 domain-containing protein [Streptomyces sp. NBC_01669]